AWSSTMAEQWTQPGPPADESGYLDALAHVMFQTGISWRVVEAKWPGIRAAFRDFDPDRVAALGAADIDRLMGDTRVIRNRKKLEAVVVNARLMRDLAREHGGFGSYLDSVGDFEAARTDLKKRFAFVGDSGAWWFLWAVGRPVPQHERH